MVQYSSAADYVQVYMSGQSSLHAHAKRPFRQLVLSEAPQMNTGMGGEFNDSSQVRLSIVPGIL